MRRGKILRQIWLSRQQLLSTSYRQHCSFTVRKRLEIVNTLPHHGQGVQSLIRRLASIPILQSQKLSVQAAAKNILPLENPEMALPEKKIVLVIGSSIAGSVFALQLLTHPILRSIYRPILFDGAATIPGLGNSDIAPFDHPAGQSGAAVALSKQAMYPLRRLELGPGLDDICQNTERLSMYRQPWSGSRDGSHEGIQIINWEAGPDVGVMGGLWTVQRGALQGLLVKTILDRGGEVIPRRKLIKIVEHESRGDSGAVEAIFADGHSQRGDLLIGADGAWSTSRQHLYTKTTASGEQIVDEAWKPDFKDLHIVHGISHAETTDDKPSIYGMGFHGVSTGTWTLKGNRQMWTIYEAPCPPPENSKSWTQGENASEALSKKWNKDVFTGGYDQASTEAFIERFRQVWHPSAGTFGKLFDATEKIVRVGLWQKLFTRLGNVQWSPKEKRPKECGSDLGGDSSNGNIVLIGDAARVLMPSAGQGILFYHHYPIAVFDEC